jgi:hypothetical protein
MYAKQGSIIFVILIFFIIISALIYSSLRTNGYFISIAREREQHEMLYQLVYALQRFALENYADHIKATDPIASKVVLFKAPWPNATSNYEGYVWLNREKRGNNKIAALYTDIRLNKKVIISLKV